MRVGRLRYAAIRVDEGWGIKSRNQFYVFKMRISSATAKNS